MVSNLRDQVILKAYFDYEIFFGVLSKKLVVEDREELFLIT